MADLGVEVEGKKRKKKEKKRKPANVEIRGQKGSVFAGDITPSLPLFFSFVS